MGTSGSHPPVDVTPLSYGVAVVVFGCEPQGCRPSPEASELLTQSRFPTYKKGLLGNTCPLPASPSFSSPPAQTAPARKPSQLAACPRRGPGAPQHPHLCFGVSPSFSCVCGFSEGRGESASLTTGQLQGPTHAGAFVPVGAGGGRGGEGRGGCLGHLWHLRAAHPSVRMSCGHSAG